MNTSRPRIAPGHALECRAAGGDWVFIREIKCDRRGRPNPRMTVADWQFWRCNDPDCPAQAFVPNSLIRSRINAEETRRA